MTDQKLRPFSEWITDHARGLVDVEMTQALAEVTKAVGSLDKKGEVVLKVRIEPAGSGGRTVTTRCLVQAKPPEPDAEASIFYVDESGQLVRDDPFQPTFDDVRDVDADTGEIRTVPEED